VVARKPDRRGACSKCGYSYRLRRDGTIGVHHLYCGSDRSPDPCEGSGKPPKPFDPNECGDCMEHRFATPGLAEACASVGIEHGKTTDQMLYEYLSGYHHRSHKGA
jgi:hypothetical protein